MVVIVVLVQVLFFSFLGGMESAAIFVLFFQRLSLLLSSLAGFYSDERHACY